MATSHSTRLVNSVSATSSLVVSSVVGIAVNYVLEASLGFFVRMAIVLLVIAAFGLFLHILVHDVLVRTFERSTLLRRIIYRSQLPDGCWIELVQDATKKPRAIGVVEFRTGLDGVWFSGVNYSMAGTRTGNFHSENVSLEWPELRFISRNTIPLPGTGGDSDVLGRGRYTFMPRESRPYHMTGGFVLLENDMELYGGSELQPHHQYRIDAIRVTDKTDRVTLRRGNTRARVAVFEKYIAQLVNEAHPTKVSILCEEVVPPV